MPGSRLELFADAGHFPHMDDRARFAAVLERLHRRDRAGALDAATLRDQLRAGAPPAA